MKTPIFEDAVMEIVRMDSRYDPQAYIFVREALDYTAKTLNKPDKGPARHVTGGELLEGIRRYALRTYGPMARRVLAHWGINRTEDFGEIVFNLVEKGVLGKTENDRREDFADGYDFHEAFVRPFLPAATAATRKTKMPRRNDPRASGEKEL